MDELERRLRADAARIDAEVSPALDARIRASLEAAAAERRARNRRRAPARLWWASSLTGLAAVAGVVAVMNLRQPAPPAARPDTVALSLPTELPAPLLRAEAAVLTAPLERELADLEADLEKARDAVREDLGLPVDF
jgi:hypothetical protein